MNTHSKLPKFIIGIAIMALALAACAGQPTKTAVSSVPKSNTVVAQPTAQKQLTTVKVQATASPQKATDVKPTAAKPTQKSTTAPTQAKPTEKPTTAATAEATHEAALPTAAASENLIPVGTPQAAEGLNVTPTQIEWLSKTGSEEAKKGDIFLVVTLSLENTSKTATASFNPDQILLVGPTNITLQMEALKSVSDELKAQTLKPGQTVKGVAVFEVPQTQYADKWMLEFQGGNNQMLAWTLAG
jgi:Domain of unknown function (DUF4352)